MKFLAFLLSISIAIFALSFTTVYGQASPSLQIFSPRDGEKISGKQVVVTFQANNFTFTDFRRSPEPKETEGHLHIWLDTVNPTTENAFKHISTEPYLLDDLSAGNHTLTLELVRSDHSSLTPKVAQTVKFSTTGPEATATPISKTSAQRKSPTPSIATGAVVAIIILIAVVGVAFFVAFRKKQ